MQPTLFLKELMGLNGKLEPPQVVLALLCKYKIHYKTFFLCQIKQKHFSLENDAALLILAL